MSDTKAVAALTFFLLATACADARDEGASMHRTALWGGVPVDAGDWASVAALDNRCTAVLVTERVLVYAAHCGTSFDGATFAENVQAAPRVELDRCARHPRAALGNGFDLAYCLLTEPSPVPPARILAAEHDLQLTPGTPVLQVGYGPSSENEGFGIKRWADAVVRSTRPELVVEGSDSGSCGGDSGGPLFVRLSQLDSSAADEWRVAGVLSSGESRGCEVGVDHYAPLAPVADWLESESLVSPADEPAAPPSRVIEPDRASDASHAEPEDRVPVGGCSLPPAPRQAPHLASTFAVAWALLAAARGVRRARPLTRLRSLRG